MLSEEYPEYKRETGRSGKTILHTRLTVRKSRGNEVPSHLGKDGKNNPKTDLPEVELHDATVVRPLSTAPAFSSQNQPLITILRSRFVTNKTAPRRPLVLPVLLTHSPPLGHRPLPRCALVTVRIPLLCDGSDGVDPSGVEHPRSGHRSAVLAFNFTNSHSLFAIPISQNRAHSFRSSSSGLNHKFGTELVLSLHGQVS
ncbi:hypothetical protein BLNAU_17532 [Blattamonas nauphoetae]|uniref:Transposase n=1 Tax=Blattamonas nauphoetae TaxID=2049346 RepID=A0ABQ9X738_9EUKA|nr:hypothetical protein BLNAU_17532 [Blattamonas nauphoetae]